MHIREVMSALEGLKNALDSQVPEMKFSSTELKGWGVPFGKCFRREIPAEGCSNRSGIYFILDLNNAVLYIGKATQDNLGAEIWGKFSAATRLSEDDTPVFENSKLAKYAPAELKKAIIEGQVYVGSVLIEPAEMASLTEVYLQSYCQRNDDSCLPPLNKRIG